MADLTSMYERYVDRFLDEADRNCEEVLELQSFEEFCDEYADCHREY
ncbi:hypothetical protein [Marinisporobacter balticus]|uniref:Uncharacterized protein n=1 Tax=Marinisporobacter balticus TaxID=2018667 RepID=A0A4R2LIF4_9FIRM|nr:hypothetical protein [Marinisporobacter balticus]TCO79105.1 hypothetical protein EV214_103157 [Marinisporobacter balticus]